jgi:FtsH-binding integral membrane protein
MARAATLQPAATSVRVNRFLALVYLVMALGMGGMVAVGALALYLDFINLFLLLLRASRR